ncbi:unnamed protein product [Meganyctiphanes norvegica]|uniref:Uncharacterized protein n=1 Tax=Meganyctiphanes norvegica TaxID=48144 RepID=A0AAV2RRP8_MEGNR
MIDEKKDGGSQLLVNRHFQSFSFSFSDSLVGILAPAQIFFFSFQEKNFLAKMFIPLCSIHSTEFQFSNCNIYFYFAVLLFEEQKMVDHCLARFLACSGLVVT